MYYHICTKQLCPHCLQMSCHCEQQYENTTAGMKMLCPHCKGIMSQTLITTTNTEYSFVNSLTDYLENTPKQKVLEDWDKSKEWDSVGPTINEFINSQQDIDPDIQSATNEIFWDLI